MPYVLVSHSYGGMISREFAARYPGQVAGMVLVDASSEPEVAVYDRLHAGLWIALSRKGNRAATAAGVVRKDAAGRRRPDVPVLGPPQLAAPRITVVWTTPVCPALTKKPPTAADAHAATS
jgi:pimeloyl-ACP methyl ester carboxylesterase